MTVLDLQRALSLRPVSLPEDDREVEGVYIGDLLSWVMGRAQSGDAWITIMQNQNVLAVASLSDVACVIFAENVIPDEAVISLARNKEINLLCSERSAYELAKLL